MKRWELWAGETSVSLFMRDTQFKTGEPLAGRHPLDEDADAKKVAIFYVETYVDACKARNGFLGWEPYKPMLEDLDNQTFPSTDPDIKDNQIELLKEDLECVHLYLDDIAAPRKDPEGETYSIVGRIKAKL